MTQDEKIKEVIRGVLADWHHDTVLREISTNKALDNIEKQLEILNGKVIAHEKTININLPHNISHCAQTDTIQKIRDSMISRKAVIGSIIVAIPLAGVIFGIIVHFMK
jgi:hypothetical protein